MLIKGIDLPVQDWLGDLPAAAAAGAFLVADPRGIPDPVTGKRYAYCGLPDASGQTFQLLRVDLESKAVEILAAPPAAAGGAYVCGMMAAVYDPNGGAAMNTPKVYVVAPLSAAPWVQWISFDIRTMAWDAILDPMTALALGATATTNYSLAHPCTTRANGILENNIICNGDGGVLGGIGTSNLALYNKATNAWMLLTGGGGARAAAPAAGSKLTWLPTHAGSLFSPRGGAGGGAAVIDEYRFATDDWIARVTVPAIPMGIGMDVCTLDPAPGLMAIRSVNASGIDSFNIYRVSATPGATGLAAELVARIDGLDGANHEGCAMVAGFVGGAYYLYIIPKGRRDIQRIQLPSPV